MDARDWRTPSGCATAGRRAIDLLELFAGPRRERRAGVAAEQGVQRSFRVGAGIELEEGLAHPEERVVDHVAARVVGEDFAKLAERGRVIALAQIGDGDRVLGV